MKTLPLIVLAACLALLPSLPAPAQEPVPAAAPVYDAALRAQGGEVTSTL